MPMKVIDLTRIIRTNEGMKEYANDYFIKGRPDLLHEVNRSNSALREQNMFIKKEVVSDDETGKENFGTYEPKKSGKTLKISKHIFNKRNRETELRRSKRKMELVQSENKSCEDEECYKTIKFQCCSSKRNGMVPQCNISSELPVTVISKNDLVSLKIKRGKVIEHHFKRPVLPLTQTENIELPKSKSWNLYESVLKIPAKSPTAAQTATDKSLPPPNIKATSRNLLSCLPIIKNPVLLKAVHKLNKEAFYGFDYSPEQPLKSHDVMLTSACRGNVVPSPPESIFSFDVGHVSDYDLPFIDWSSFTM